MRFAARTIFDHCLRSGTKLESSPTCILAAGLSSIRGRACFSKELRLRTHLFALSPRNGFSLGVYITCDAAAWYKKRIEKLVFMSIVLLWLPSSRKHELWERFKLIFLKIFSIIQEETSFFQWHHSIAFAITQIFQYLNRVQVSVYEIKEVQTRNDLRPFKTFNPSFFTAD